MTYFFPNHKGIYHDENSDWMPEEDIEAFRKDVDIFLEKFNATYPNGVVRK